MAEQQIPQSWALAEIQGLVGTDGLISDGDWVESKDQDPDGSVRLVQLADIGDGDFRNKSNRFMSEDKAALLNCTFLTKGDVLVARMPDPLGRACLFPGVGQQAVTVVDVCLIRTGLNSALTGRLLKYWINSPGVRSLIAENASGTTRKRITRKKLEKFEVPVPPLGEQKVIADKLDTLLAQVENTKARLESIPQILKRFRQSVLAAAVSGRLTEEWRKARNMDMSSWNETVFSEICTKVTVGFVGKMSDKYKGSGIPFLRSQNIRAFRFSDENLLYIDEEFHRKIYKSRLEAGDLAIVRSGAPGTTCVIPESLGQANCSDLVIARPSKDLNPEFGCIFMNSEVAQKNVADNQVGVAQQHFNVASMKKMPIQLPTLVEQDEVVRCVDELFGHADLIEKQVNNALARVNNLSQSTLAKAFRGELTEQWRKYNPELISGENSAEALLKHIRFEREIAREQPKKKKASTKKKTGKTMKEKISVVEALERAGEPLSGQMLLTATGYPIDSTTEELEKFFLNIREALLVEQSIVSLPRDAEGQDWFALSDLNGDQTKEDR